MKTREVCLHPSSFFGIKIYCFWGERFEAVTEGRNSLYLTTIDFVERLFLHKEKSEKKEIERERLQELH